VTCCCLTPTPHTHNPVCPPPARVFLQGYGPEVVKLMLAAGADPLLPNVEGLTALTMTANQVGRGHVIV
jgi:hypothetical protein